MSKSEEWGKERAATFAKSAMKSVYAPMAERITAHWPRSYNFTFLDLGTGPGLLPVEVKRLFPRARAIGVDPSEDMLNVARRNAESSKFPGIEIRPGKAEEIPVDSASIDLLMAQFSLHEWEDTEKGFSEIARVLKPNGVVVIRDWDKSCPRLKFWKHNIEHMFKYGWQRAKEARKSYRQSYPFRIVVDLVCKYDLEPVETEEDVMFFIKAKKVGNPPQKNKHVAPRKTRRVI